MAAQPASMEAWLHGVRVHHAQALQQQPLPAASIGLQPLLSQMQALHQQPLPAADLGLQSLLSQTQMLQAHALQQHPRPAPADASLQSLLSQMQAQARHAHALHQPPPAAAAADPGLQSLLSQMQQHHARTMAQTPTPAARPDAQAPLAELQRHSAQAARPDAQAQLAELQRYHAQAACREPTGAGAPLESSVMGSLTGQGVRARPEQPRARQPCPSTPRAVAGDLARPSTSDQTGERPCAEAEGTSTRRRPVKPSRKTQREAVPRAQEPRRAAAAGGPEPARAEEQPLRPGAPPAPSPPSAELLAAAAAPAEREAPTANGVDVPPLPKGEALPAPPARGGLNLLEDGAWLAKELGMEPSAAEAEPKRPTVIIDLERLWGAAWEQLPEPTFGCGPQTHHFGVLFGQRAEGVLHLGQAEVCPDPFTFSPSVPPGGSGRSGASVLELVAALEAELQQALRRYLEETFAPWAACRESREGEPCAAWLICNDGDAYALPRPLLDFATATAALWRRTAVVADRAKSSRADAALEVIDLTGPQPERLLYDVGRVA